MVNAASALRKWLMEGDNAWANPVVRVTSYGAAVTALGFAGLANALVIGPYFVDDAYITLHNAQVLLRGADANYAGSSALAGATCAPHVVLVALLLFALPGPWAVWVASLLGALAFACGLVRLCEVRRLLPLTTLGTVISGLTIANTPYQLLNGLETSWAMAGVTWALVFSVSPGQRAKRAAAAACGTIPFLRPELAALSALLMLVLSLESAPQLRVWRLGSRREALALVLAFGAAALPWLAFYTLQTGTPIPSTIAAKAAYFAEGCASTQWKVQTFVSIFRRFFKDSGPWPLALLALPLMRTGAASLLFVLVFVVTYFLRFPGALGHYAQRYLYVLTPLMILGTITLVRHKRRNLRVTGNALLTAGVAFNLWHLPEAAITNDKVARVARVELTKIAAAAREHIPQEATVLVHDAGYISYATDLHLVDLVGLKTPENVTWHQHLTLPTCGRQRGHAVHEIALHSGAAYFIALRDWDEIYGLTSALTAFGWGLEPLVRRRTGYDLYRLTPPEAPHTPH